MILHSLFLVIHVGLAIALLALVLVQQGKGAEAGAAFGGSATAFGTKSGATFVTKLTSGVAAGFFATSLALGYFVTQSREPTSVIERTVIETPSSLTVPRVDRPTDLPAPVEPIADPALSDEPGLEVEVESEPVLSEDRVEN